MATLKLSASFNFGSEVASIPSVLASPGQLTIPNVGAQVIEQRVLIGATDVALDLGGVTTPGWVFLMNLNLVGAIPPEPVISPITQVGTPGTKQYAYDVVAHFADGSISVADDVQTFTGNDALTATNYNVVSWSNVGAATYDVYRDIAGGATTNTTGKIASGLTAVTYNDQGAAGDGKSTPNEVASTFEIQWGSVSGTYDRRLYAGEYAQLRLNSAAIHVKNVGPPVTLPNLLYVIVQQ